MFAGLEIVQNFLMRFPPIARIGQACHSTGLRGDPALSKKVFEFYSGFASAVGKDILEIGPGQTLEVLEEAVSAGARSCAAVDVVRYLSPHRAKAKGIRYRTYDGKALPFADAQFDLLWSHTAFEHLRYPDITVQECFRVLRPGGTLVVLIDLADHSFYGQGEPDPLQVFHCLKYSDRVWNLMKWNRSSYVNRLRRSEWLKLFSRTGFEILHEHSETSDAVSRALPLLPYLQRYSHEDAVTCTLSLHLRRPPRSPSESIRQEETCEVELKADRCP